MGERIDEGVGKQNEEGQNEESQGWTWEEKEEHEGVKEAGGQTGESGEEGEIEDRGNGERERGSSTVCGWKNWGSHQ